MLSPNAVLQNRYVVVRELGRGGMGAVYEAVDRRFNSRVAIKQTLVADAGLRRAFAREAQLLNSLRHRALPVVSDFFDEGDGQFLVMQYIPGDDMAGLLRANGGPFPADAVARWGCELLEALAYLHSRTPPILHRDIKPQNLKLTPEGDVVLLDFGLAKGSLDHMTRATTGSIQGYTPSYAALEQIRGQGTDERSDLYSLGATLYHLLTNQQPADALARADALLQGQDDPLAPADRLNPRVPPAVADVVRRAMALRRDERPASAVAMLQGLRAAAQALPGAWSALEPQQAGARTVFEAPAPSAPHAPVAPTSVSPTVPLDGGRAADPTAPLHPAVAPTVALAPGSTAGATPAATATAPERGASPSGVASRLAALAGLIALGVCLAVVVYSLRSVREGNSNSGGGIRNANTNARAGAGGTPVSLTAFTPFTSPVDVLEAAASADGSFVVTAGADGSTRLWSAPAGKPLGLPFGEGSKPVRCVAVRPDGTIVTGSDDGRIRLWTKPHTIVGGFAGHAGGTFALSLSPDGTKLVSAGYDGTVRVWSLPDGTRGGEKTAPSRDLLVLGVNAGRSLVAYLDRAAGTVTIADVASTGAGEPPISLDLHGAKVSCGAFDDAGEILAVGTEAGHLMLWDARTGAPLGDVDAAGMVGGSTHGSVGAFGPPGRGALGALAIAPNGTIAAGFANGVVRLFKRPESGLSIVDSLEAYHESAVVTVAFSADSRTIVSAAEDRSARVMLVTMR